MWRRRWFPIVLAIIGSAASFLVWDQLRAGISSQQQMMVAADLAFAATRVNSQVSTRIRSLERMARRWGEGLTPSESAWEFDAALVYEPQTQEAIAWIDPASQIRWAVPPDRKTRFQNRALNFEPRRAKALQSAATSGQARLTAPVELFSGGKGFIALVPIRDDGRLLGFMAGVFDAQQFFDAILKDLLPGAGVVVMDGTEEIYRRADVDTSLESVLGQERTVNIAGRQWRVLVWPQPESMVLTQSRMPEVVLLAGLTMSFLLGLTVFLAQTSRSRAEELEAANRLLEEQYREREEMAEQLRLAQRMESIGRLAGGVAHDFNNWLGVILGHSDLLVERLEGNAPLRRNAEEIHKAAERATDLTRQLLAFGRRQMMEPRVIDLNAVVGEMDSLLRRMIGEDVNLVTRLKDDLGQVKADPSQIEQVVMNLAINARDAMPQGGKLTIETSNADLDESYARTHVTFIPGRYVMLSVSDTGSGMDEFTRAHIFEPFFTTKEKGKGTGLGLATVYGVVKQSGGYIWVYSEPGRGTTFKIYLPRVDKLPEQRRPEPAVTAVGGGETVLVVEDEAALRELIHEFLIRAGYIVLQADTAARAEELAAGHPGAIHLLLTDVVLPDRSGRALAENMAAHREGLKTLYISGYTDNAIVHHGVLDANTAFLQKPFTRDSLLRKLRSVLDASA